MRGPIGRIPSVLARIVALFAAFLALAGAGCGGERTFTPQGFIDDMNGHGAALALGDVLTTNPDGIDVWAVSLTNLAPSATGEGATPEVAPTAATLLVFADADAARTEFDRCDGAPSLTCFRAANAVLRVEDIEPSDQARLTTAIEAIGDEG